MIHQEIGHHAYHYTLLILVEAVLLSFFVVTKDQVIQLLLAAVVGLFYTIWGVSTHRGQLLTLRLVLEYATVGLLAAVMLAILVGSV